MSLINDALKRAKEAQRPPPQSGVPPMRPVEIKRKEQDFSVALPVLIIFLIVTAFFFIGLAMAKKHTVIHREEKIVAAPAIASTHEVVAAVAPVANPPLSGSPAMNPPASPAEGISPAAIKVEAPKPIRIQGIAYDPVFSWAIVNGKTVYAGDFVDGMRVTAISRNSITLVGNGQTNTLGVGQQ
jgi:hypothetical protein